MWKTGSVAPKAWPWRKRRTSCHSPARWEPPPIPASTAIATPTQKVILPARASIAETARAQKGTLTPTSAPVSTSPIRKRTT